MEGIANERWLPIGDGKSRDDGFWEKSLKLSSRSIETIASNIANADTPNFQAKSLDFQAALANAVRQAAPVELASTNSQHLKAPPQETGDPFVNLRTSLQPSIDNNTVDLDAERAAFAEATVRHRFTMDRAIGEYTGKANWIKALT